MNSPDNIKRNSLGFLNPKTIPNIKKHVLDKLPIEWEEHMDMNDIHVMVTVRRITVLYNAEKILSLENFYRNDRGYHPKRSLRFILRFALPHFDENIRRILSSFIAEKSMKYPVKWSSRGNMYIRGVSLNRMKGLLKTLHENGHYIHIK